MSKTIITPASERIFPDFEELFRYRHLISMLAWRDIKVKYAQTAVGIAWAFLNPIVSLMVLVFVFSTIAKINSDGIPTIVIAISGLCIWNYFSILFSEAGNSVVDAQNMIKKIYFPRLVLPLSKAISGLVDFAITLILLVVVMLFYNIMPTNRIVYAPLFISIAILSGVTGGLWMSALSVRFRDFRFVIPLITRLGMFITPVAYTSSNIPEKYQILYFLNPLVGAIEGFRWCFLGIGELNSYMVISIGILVFLFITGLYFFNKVEHTMADII